MSYTTSTIKRNRGKKLNASKGAIAVSLAKKKDDPLYKRMIKFKQLYKQNKSQLERKYASKARTLAMQSASRHRYESGQPKLYRIFLSEQTNVTKEVGQEILKDFAQKQKLKFENNCDIKYRFLKTKTAKAEMRLCHLNAKIAYLQIMFNGLRTKVSECKSYKCKQVLILAFKKIEFQLRALINKAKTLHQEILRSKTNA